MVIIPTPRAGICNGSLSTYCYFLTLILKDILPIKQVEDPTFTSRDIRDTLKRKGIPFEMSYLPGYLRAGEIFRFGDERLLHELITFSRMRNP